MLAVHEGAPAVRDVVEHPLDAVLQLGIGEAVSVERRHMQELNARLRERLGIVLRLEAAIHHGRHTARREIFDLASAECAANGEPRSDVRVIQLLGLDIGEPLHEPRQHPQPEATARSPEALDDSFAIGRIRERRAQTLATRCPVLPWPLRTP